MKYLSLILAVLLLSPGYTTVTFASCGANEGNNNTLDLYLQKPGGCAITGYTITVKRGTTGTFTDYDGNPTFSGSPPTFHYSVQVNSLTINCGFPRVVQSVLAWTNAARTLPAGGIQLWGGMDTVNSQTGNLTNSCDTPFTGAPAPTNCIVKISTKNNDNSSHWFTLYKDGAVAIVSGVPTPCIQIAAGATGTVTFTDPACGGGWSLVYNELFDGNPSGATNNTPIVTSTNVTVTTNTGVAPSDPSAGTFSPPGNTTFGGTNATGSITFNSNNTNTLKEGTFQIAETAIYDALNRGFNTLDKDLKQGQANDLTYFQGLTNAIGHISVTAGTNDSSAAVRNFHIDNTNLLTQIRDQGTNQTPSNMLASITGSMTNAASATNAGNALFGGQASGIDGIISGLGSPPSIGTGGGGSALTMAFLDTEINVDPEHFAPGLMGYLKNFISLVALIGFGIYAANLLFKTAQTYASASSGGVPDLEATAAGFGGNIAGLIVAGLVAVAFVTVWLLVWGWVINAIVGQITSVATVGGLENPNATATYLITSVFPVSLLLTLAWTRITLPLGAAKVIGIAASASRFLIGK